MLSTPDWPGQHPYATLAYAQSLPHIGAAHVVPEWGTSVLLRECGGGQQDATGPYPITVFAPSADLRGGLERLTAEGLVSVVIVLAPTMMPADLSLFGLVRPLKTHYLARPDREHRLSKHHRYELNRTRRSVETRLFSLADYLGHWVDLYRALVARHKLEGSLHDFPPEHHEALAAIHGVTAIGAFKGGDLVSAHLWVGDQNAMMSHLAASSVAGYEIGAAYAVNQAAIDLFGGNRVLNFGGAAGGGLEGDSGLDRFKRGFANDTASSLLCGHILDAEAYAQRVGALESGRDGHFPAYRTP